MLLSSLIGPRGGRKSDPIMDLWSAILSGGAPSKAGPSVTAETALKVMTVLGCVRALAEGIAQLPFKLFREDGRTKLPATDHPLYRVLHRRPNEWQTSFEWRETMMIHAVLTGDGLSFINRIGGRVAELIPLIPGQVTVEQGDDYTLTYAARLKDGSTVRLSRRDVFHLRGPSWNGYCGLEAVHLAREAIGLALATEETHARLHSNGARPGGILTTDATLTPDQVQDLRVAWQATQGGVENAMRTAILSGGLQWQQLAMTGVDSQHIETRKFQIEEICRAMKVFPQMVGHAGDQTPTYASAEQFFLAHVIYSLGPWIERFEQVCDRDLLSDQDVASGHFTKFNVNGLLRGAAADRADYYTKLYNVGALSPNDIRGYEDLNPYEGGDEYRVPLNMAPPGQDVSNAGDNADVDADGQ